MTILRLSPPFSPSSGREMSLREPDADASVRCTPIYTHPSWASRGVSFRPLGPISNFKFYCSSSDSMMRVGGFNGLLELDSMLLVEVSSVKSSV